MRRVLLTLIKTVQPSIWGGGRAVCSVREVSGSWGMNSILLSSALQADHRKSSGLWATILDWQIQSRIVICSACAMRWGCASALSSRLTRHRRKSAEVSRYDRMISMSSIGIVSKVGWSCRCSRCSDLQDREHDAGLNYDSSQQSWIGSIQNLMLLFALPCPEAQQHLDNVRLSTDFVHCEYIEDNNV